MAKRSRGCSTTQMSEASRLGSEQIGQGSASVMFEQIEQRRVLRLTSRIAWASAMASASGTLRTWSARRSAERGPIPGSFSNSAIRRVRDSV